MGENSKIEWTDHTFNPWVGCERISPACDNCYAESWARRTGQGELWQGTRRRTTPANWRKPLRWNADAKARGVRARVFCASLADVFDNEVSERWRTDLIALIHETPQLDWLLLTKRVGNVSVLTPFWSVTGWPQNVWLGSTVVTQREIERDVPKLLHVPARVRFLSCEPLIERLDLSGALSRISKIHWVIVGGESGAHARPMDPAWCDEIRQDCAHAGAKFFMKQGSSANWPSFRDFTTFPPKLQRREFPS